MREKKYRKLRADAEMRRREADAMDKITEVLRPLSARKAARVVVCAAILLGHGDLVGVPGLAAKGGK